MILGLTVHRPYHWALLHAGKGEENRSWKPYSSVLGTRIALHAGTYYDLDAAARMRAGEYGAAAQELPAIDPLAPGGFVIATTVVVGWIALTYSTVHGVLVSETSDMPPGVIARAMASPWITGPFVWVLRGTRALPEPVPCVGRQRLFVLPADVERDVREQEQPCGVSRSL